MLGFGVLKGMLTTLGHVRLDQGQRLAALEAFVEAMQRAQMSGERICLIRALEGCARCFAASDADAGVRLAGTTDAHRRVLGARQWPT